MRYSGIQTGIQVFKYSGIQVFVDHREASVVMILKYLNTAVLILFTCLYMSFVELRPVWSVHTTQGVRHGPCSTPTGIWCGLKVLLAVLRGFTVLVKEARRGEYDLRLAARTSPRA